MDNTKEYILCAAVKRRKPRTCIHHSNPYYPGTNDILDIELGYRHHDIYHRFYTPFYKVSNFLRKIHLYKLACWINIKTSVLDQIDQGFYTSTGRYVDRNEAMKIAIECGQIESKTVNGSLQIKSNNINSWRTIGFDKSPLFSEDLY